MDLTFLESFRDGEGCKGVKGSAGTPLYQAEHPTPCRGCGTRKNMSLSRGLLRLSVLIRSWDRKFTCSGVMQMTPKDVEDPGS